LYKLLTLDKKNADDASNNKAVGPTDSTSTRGFMEKGVEPAEESKNEGYAKSPIDEKARCQGECNMEFPRGELKKALLCLVDRKKAGVKW